MLIKRSISMVVMAVIAALAFSSVVVEANASKQSTSVAKKHGKKKKCKKKGKQIAKKCAKRGKQGKTGTNGVNGVNGKDGVNGETGVDGKSGANGAEGDTGNTGAQGQQGEQGPQGNSGPAGKSVYQLAVEGGYEGTFDEWVEDLRGEDGEDGDDGDDGENGFTGYEIVGPTDHSAQCEDHGYSFVTGATFSTDMCWTNEPGYHDTTVSCPEGKIALSGGIEVLNENSNYYYYNYWVLTRTSHPVVSNSVARAWNTEYQVDWNGYEYPQVQAFAVCANAA